MLYRPTFWLALALTAATWGAALALLVAPAPIQVVSVGAAGIVPSSAYDYAAPPSISRDTYQSIWCDAGSAACSEAGDMYDVLVAAGLDPVVEAAQASHETQLGTDGVGRPAYKNAHGVQCHDSDDLRIGTTPVPWGNKCAGVYASYRDAVEIWARVIVREYVNEGYTTPDRAVWKYAPTTDGNDPPAYIADMEAKIDAWRAREQFTQPQGGALDPRRRQVVELALSQLGKPYNLGSAGPDTFDCSGLVQWSYAQIGVETTRTTFTQLDALPAADPADLQPGDLIYQQFPSDQHVVMYIGDIDGDGTGDVVEAGGYLDGPNNVNVLYDFFGSHPVFTSAIIGYRRAL